MIKKIFKSFKAITLVAFATYMINGLVLFTLWNWLVVPIFSVSQLRMTEATGLIVLIDYLKYRKINNYSKEIKKLTTTDHILLLAFRATIVISSGYVVQFLM